MLKHTNIEYCINPDGSRGYGWLIVTGCAQPASVCATQEKCWARSLHRRFKGCWTGDWVDLYNPDFSPRFNEQLIEEPLSLCKPSRILVGFTGDMFGPGVEREWIEKALEIVQILELHTFIFLTKSPERYKDFTPWPDNCWLGASACNLCDFDRAMESLEQVQARVRWISLEPLLSWDSSMGIDFTFDTGGHLDWLVVGRQSSPGTIKPKPDNVLDIIEAAKRTDVKLWIKDNLLHLYPQLPKRQEVP